MSVHDCDRCGRETLVLTMSIFNTEMICMTCEQKEMEHPEYRKAKDVELEQVRRGNYNYPGIGKPKDLN